MGYRNPVITLRFDHLVEEDDTCHVTIRNPQLIPAGEFRAVAGGRRADRERIAAAKAAIDAGQDVPEDLLSEEDTDRTFEFMAGLIVGWRVWDPTVPVKVDEQTGELIRDETTEPRLLPIPATAETVALLPQEILMALTEKMTLANPQPDPATGTSKTS